MNFALLRTGLIVTGGAGIGCLVLGLCGFAGYQFPADKLLNSSAALFGIAAIIQLKESGWIDSVEQTFSDQEKHPSGPPSYIVRHIGYNPDRPIRTYLRDTLFFDSRTGAALAVSSLIVSLVAAWA